MSMQPIVMKIALFRGDWDQARSQYSLLWCMEALVRINQSHIRQFRRLAKEGKVPAPYPPIYRSGVHYEPEPGTEEWLDVPNILAVHGGTFPGPWGDCLPLSTLTLRDDYTLAPIGALKPGDKIMDNGRFATVLEHAITGVKPILAFDLDNGCTLRCSPNHRVFLSDGREVRAENVKIGDHMRTPTEAFPTSQPWRDEALSPENLAWMAGVYAADGWHELPRHPRFAISGRDGKPKEAQKKRVKEIAEAAGMHTRWHERYIAVNDKRLASIMAACGGHAPEKRLPTLRMSREQVLAALEGLRADSSRSISGTITHGTTSSELAIQIRLLYRMLGQSVHIKRWDDHGGLGSHPIYRVGVRTRVSTRSTSASVEGIREEAPELCADITTDTGSFYLPESDLIVHNCEDLACWRAAELREDPHNPQKAKPFAKWRRKPDGAYAYHALVLLPNGSLEDPSLVLGMAKEPEFARLQLAQRYKEGSLTPAVQYAKIPDVVVVDPDKPSGFGKDIEAAKKRTGLDTPPPGAPITGMITGKMPGAGVAPQPLGGGFQNGTSNEDGSVAGWGFDRASVDVNDMRNLANYQRQMRRRNAARLRAGVGETHLFGQSRSRKIELIP